MSGAVTVRLLGPGDETVLDRVADEVFDGAVDPALVREMLGDPRHHLAVAIENGAVVSFASGMHYVHLDKRAQMFVNEVATAPTHQRRGIGRAVLDALLDHARALGCGEAWVLTDRDNEAAQALYRAVGAAPPEPCVMFTVPLDEPGPA